MTEGMKKGLNRRKSACVWGGGQGGKGVKKKSAIGVIIPTRKKLAEACEEEK